MPLLNRFLTAARVAVCVCCRCSASWETARTLPQPTSRQQRTMLSMRSWCCSGSATAASCATQVAWCQTSTTSWQRCVVVCPGVCVCVLSKRCVSLCCCRQLCLVSWLCDLLLLRQLMDCSGGAHMRHCAQVQAPGQHPHSSQSETRKPTRTGPAFCLLCSFCRAGRWCVLQPKVSLSASQAAAAV